MPPRRSSLRSRRSVLRGIGATLGIGALAGCTQDQACRVPDAGRGGRGNPGSSYGTGDTPDRFYTGEPPSRSGQTVDATNHDSLQAAYDGLQAGDTLFIPESGGPYREQLSTTTDHTSVISNGDGAWIEQPGGESWALGSPSPTHTPETSLSHPIAGGGQAQDGGTDAVGDREIRVADTSPFSVGDDIYVLEAGRPYGEPRSGGASGPDETREYRTVTDIDHNASILSVHYPMFLPYPMNNRTEVGRMDWTATDIHISGVNVRGRGSGDGSHAVEFGGVKNGWFDTMRIEESADDSLALTDCYQCRTDDIQMIDGGGYGIQIRGSTHTYCTKSLGDGIVNYTVRAGGSAVDVLAEGVTGRNYRSRNEGPVAASHWGSFYVVYRGVQVEGEQLVRFRTRHMTVEDFDVSGTDTREMVWSQRPFHVIVRDGDIGNYPSGANEKIFHFRLRGNDSPFGDEEAGNVLIEDVRIEPNGAGPGNIGMFSDGCVIRDLYIREVYYGDQKLTRQHVEQWDGFGQANITNLVVE